jgi:hypothetical protein
MANDPRVRSRQSPGWYTDPRGRNVLRWWDGQSWTERTKDMPGVPQADFRDSRPPARRQDPSDQGLGYGRIGTGPHAYRDYGAVDRDNAGDRAVEREAPRQVQGRPRGGLPLSRQPAPTRAENWELEPAQAEADDDDALAQQDGRVRLALSGAFGISLVLLAIGYAFDLNALRLLGLGCVLFFGVGTAPLQLAERVRLDVRFGTAALVGLSVPLTLASVMVLVPVWYPAIASLLVGVAAVAVHAVACRRILSGPLRDGILRSEGERGRLLDASIACTAAGTIAWLAGLLMTGSVLLPGHYGFLTKVPPYWYLGLALVIAGIVLSYGKGELRAVLGVVSLLSALTLTPAVLYGMPRSQSAAKHIDLVETILQVHFLNRGTGIYQAYSGFFSGIAWIADLAGTRSIDDIIAIATYWPFIVELFILAGLRFFFGRMVSSWYRIWLAITLVILVNAIGADYFSPQSAGFALGVAAFPLALQRDFEGFGQRTRMALLVLAGCALAVTHELSPYVVGGVLVLMVIFRIIRPWWIPATIFGPALLWALLNKSVLSGFVSISSLGSFSNFAPPKTIATPGLSRQAVVGQSSHALTLGLLILIAIAGIGLLRNLRSRPAWAFSCAPAIGLALIAANAYGNEGIFRAALFGIPWLAAVALLVLPVKPSRLVAGVCGIVAAVLVGTYAISMFGLDDLQVISPGDYQALLNYEATASPSSYLIEMNYGNIPVSLDFPAGFNHEPGWTDVLKVTALGTGAPSKAEVNRFAEQVYSYAKKNDGKTQELYAIWSPVTANYSVDYGLETYAQARGWRDMMMSSPYWKVTFAKDGTYLFRVNNSAVTAAMSKVGAKAKATAGKAKKPAAGTAKKPAGKG